MRTLAPPAFLRQDLPQLAEVKGIILFLACTVSHIMGKERATRKNSQRPMWAKRLALLSSQEGEAGRCAYAPCRRPILNGTTSPLYVR